MSKTWNWIKKWRWPIIMVAATCSAAQFVIFDRAWAPLWAFIMWLTGVGLMITVSEVRDTEVWQHGAELQAALNAEFDRWHEADPEVVDGNETR